MNSDFSAIVEKISEYKLLLPDFQRGFTWTKEEQQKRLVASVLTRLPIGSILLLESKPDEYAAHVIGRREKKLSTDKLPQEVRFLLDGQQRVTVLSNVFSNVIYEESGDFSLPESLRRRFFLKIPHWEQVFCSGEGDCFGLAQLNFSAAGADREPDFLTDDILPFITCRSFKRGDGAPYNPESPNEIQLIQFCVNADKECYLIPLYLFINTAKTNRSQKVLLEKVWDRIQQSIIDEISIYYEKASQNEQESIWREVLGCTEDIPQHLDSSCIPLGDAVSVWKKSVLDYLHACIKWMEINQIEVQAEKRARAIDIYEQMNLGGVSLSTFDLIMAKAATIPTKNNDNIYNQIKNYIQCTRTYPDKLLTDEFREYAKPYFEKQNASMAFACINEKGNARGEIDTVYIDAFLNILSLYIRNKEMDSEEVSLQHTKRESILRLPAEEIVACYEKVCTALDRACFFLKLRCGIRRIGELHYKLILTVIGFVFMKDDYFENVRVHNCLEAWYWCVLFSGEYDRDQNRHMELHIKNLLRTFASTDQNRFKWLEDLNKDRVFAEKNFSDKGFLLMENCQVTGLAPKKVLRQFICQYYLSRTYADLFKDERIHNFSAITETLEQHHIIPVGSTWSIKEFREAYKENKRDNDKHIVNSPLNFIYITKDANVNISTKTVREYRRAIRIEAYAKLSLQIFKNLPEGEITEENIRDCLKDRFDAVKGEVMDEVNTLLFNSR